MTHKKVYVLLEDDTEILGNGIGHVMYRQYLPVKQYVNILNQYDIKSTFYVDIAHYLFLKQHSKEEDFAIQADLIEKMIEHLLINKMEVQLHMHSQWLNAEYKDGNIYVTDKWNIGQLKSEEQEMLFEKCTETLFQIINKYTNNNPLNSYKAGSWGLQPFQTLYNAFKKKGVLLVMGPIKGLRVSSLKVDYTTMESDSIPYYCDKNDINRISSKEEVVVLPMTPTYLNWLDFLRYIYHIKKDMFSKKPQEIDCYRVPDKVKALKPLANKDKLNFTLKPFKTHLKINAQPFWYLKNTFHRSYKSVKKNNSDYKLIVIETHTKDFKNTFSDIEKFFNYVKSNYKDVEFITSSKIVADIENGILKPLIK
jgi:hypothetical protein